MSHTDATAVLLTYMGATSAAPNLFTPRSKRIASRAKGYQALGGMSQSIEGEREDRRQLGQITVPSQSLGENVIWPHLTQNLVE